MKRYYIVLVYCALTYERIGALHMGENGILKSIDKERLQEIITEIYNEEAAKLPLSAYPLRIVYFNNRCASNGITFKIEEFYDLN
jgi:hypothetical protein